MQRDAPGGAVRSPVQLLSASEARSPDPIPTETETGMYGTSPALRMLRASIALYARSTATVVIQGETGTGKELIAYALHRLSPRASGPFVAANVAALSESVVTSELFGHERGAFTGAHAQHRGLFEQADRGTLFLDEIAELTHDNQARLLRVLESGEIRPIGCERTRKVSVRLVVATHQPLAAAVTEGLFRADLFYRLHTLVLAAPALRERIEDIPRIADHLLARIAPEVGRRQLHAQALLRLQQYPWPGNIRQLANVLRRAAVRSPHAELGPTDIHDALVGEPDMPSGSTAGSLSAATIREVLRAHGGRLAPAARALGIPRSTLRARMHRLGVARGP